MDIDCGRLSLSDLIENTLVAKQPGDAQEGWIAPLCGGPQRRGRTVGVARTCFLLPPWLRSGEGRATPLPQTEFPTQTANGSRAVMNSKCPDLESWPFHRESVCFVFSGFER